MSLPRQAQMSANTNIIVGSTGIKVGARRRSIKSKIG